MAIQATFANIFAVALLVRAAKADPPWGNGNGGGFGGGFGGGGPWNWGNNNNNNNNNNDNDSNNAGQSFGNEQNGYGLGNIATFDRANTVLLAHAVIASAVWVLFVPWAALLLRINSKSPIVLKLHAFFQVLAYLLYIVAAGMGIWLAQQTSAFGTWEDVHPRLGLAILVIAFFQPIFGFVHHRMFKKRAAAAKDGKMTKPPCRTTIGRVHLWVGRALIVMGVINGGLGIRLASFSPFRTNSQTRTAGIVYGVVAAVMFVLYTMLVVLFEVRRKHAQRNTAVPTAYQETKGLPTYEESQSSATSSLSSRQNTGQVAGATGGADGGLPRYS